MYYLVRHYSKANLGERKTNRSNKPSNERAAARCPIQTGPAQDAQMLSCTLAHAFLSRVRRTKPTPVFDRG